MLDRVMAGLSTERYILQTPEYSPELAVILGDIVNPDSANLAVLFPPWHGGGVFIDHFARSLVKEGNAVLQYKFHDEILKPNVEQVKDSFSYLQAYIALQLENNAKRFDRIYLFGASLGNVALALVAEAFPDFTDATLVAAGASLATATWDGIRTQKIRLALEESGVTREGLVESWYDLAPSAHASAFKSKSVFAFPSKVDEVIPSDSQFDLINSLYKSGARVSVRASRVGHYGTIGMHYLLGRSLE